MSSGDCRWRALRARSALGFFARTDGVGMNASDKLPLSSLLAQDPTHGQALALFPLESLQNLDVDSARSCQAMLGHGATFGI